MGQSIMKAASSPKSVTQSKSSNEGLLSYFTSRASWAAIGTLAVGAGAGGVYLAYNALTSSNPVDSARDTLGDW